MVRRKNQDASDAKESRKPIFLPPYTLRLIEDLMNQFTNYVVNMNNRYQLDQRIEYLLTMAIGLFIGVLTAMICYHYGVDGITTNEFIDWILSMPWMDFQK